MSTYPRILRAGSKPHLDHYPIPWARVGDAVTFYNSHGYEYVEVPWVVSKESVAITIPQDVEPTHHPDGILVGSAEQSFIELMRLGRLTNGRYVAASPCFRGDKFDGWHQPSFFKVELISIMTKSLSVNHAQDEFNFMVGKASEFFRKFLGNSRFGHETTIDTTESFDILINDIEVGSYGVREHSDFSWVYGTGLAEPRFSMALARE